MKIKKIILTTGLLLALILPQQIALAQVQLSQELKPANVTSIEVSGGSRASIANIILQTIAGSLIYAAGPIAVLVIVWGGLLYVTSHGDNTQVEKAKKTITWAIIGLLTIIVSWLIVTSVLTVTTSGIGVSGTDSVDKAPATTPPAAT